MKKICFWICCLGLYGQVALALDASVIHANFYAEQLNYVELYIGIVGKTASYQKLPSGQYQASVEVQISFYSSDSIVKSDQFILNGPESGIAPDFMDVKRYRLEDGSFHLVVRIIDTNARANQLLYEADLDLKNPGEELVQSDILLLNRVQKSDDSNSVFVKNGLFLEPMPFHFFHKWSSRLSFYHEIYNSDLAIGDDFMIRYGLEPLQASASGKVLLVGHKRKKAVRVLPVLFQLDIRDLPTGRYRLFVELRHRNSQLLSKKTVEFVRANPNLSISRLDISDEDLEGTFVSKLEDETLQYTMRAIALKVVSSELEQLNSIMKGENRKDKERFVYAFFLNQNPNDPVRAYNKYMALANELHHKFRSGMGYGFESDRGRIYMVYGPPTDIIKVEDEPTAPPYEIWIYHDFPQTRQSNVKFLFYNPSLGVGGLRIIAFHSKW